MGQLLVLVHESVSDHYIRYGCVSVCWVVDLVEKKKLQRNLKSQLAEIFEAQVNIPDREPKGDAVIIDGSALINALPPRTSKIFDDSAKEDIIPKVESYGARYERVDVVFDVYKKSSPRQGRKGGKESEEE